MPELAEVEAARRSVQALCANRRILQVQLEECGDGPRNGQFDELVFRDDYVKHQSAESLQTALKNALTGRRFSEMHRRGKQMWIELHDSDAAVLFHFGMTGAFMVRNYKVPNYKLVKHDSSVWPPKFCKMMICFEGDVELAFCDPRRLGRIMLRSTPVTSVEPISLLGIDPVIDGVPHESELLELFASHSCSVKALLLDQQKVFCGIGNWLTDEMLYQSRIHPENRANALNLLALKQLRTSMLHILTVAVDVDADYTRFPPEWIFHHRWEKRVQRTNRLTLPDGNVLVFETVGGRTSAIVPALQVRNDARYCQNTHGKNSKASIVSTPNAGKKARMLKTEKTVTAAVNATFGERQVNDDTQSNNCSTDGGEKAIDRISNDITSTTKATIKAASARPKRQPQRAASYATVLVPSATQLHAAGDFEQFAYCDSSSVIDYLNPSVLNTSGGAAAEVATADDLHGRRRISRADKQAGTDVAVPRRKARATAANRTSEIDPVTTQTQSTPEATSAAASEVQSRTRRAKRTHNTLATATPVARNPRKRVKD